MNVLSENDIKPGEPQVPASRDETQPQPVREAPAIYSFDGWALIPLEFEPA